MQSPLDSFSQNLTQALLGAPPSTSDYDLNGPAKQACSKPLREAAVLVPFLLGPDEVRIVMTKRSSKLRHHPGQISFPGGKRDAQDEDLEKTALREAYEEIRLPTKNVDIIGKISPHETVTGFYVTPYFGIIKEAFAPKPDLNEVAEVFTVPLAHFLNPQNFHIETRQWQGQPRSYYTIPYGPFYIWGASARILKSFSDRMRM